MESSGPTRPLPSVKKTLSSPSSQSTRDALSTLEQMLCAECDAIRLFFEARHRGLLQTFYLSCVLGENILAKGHEAGEDDLVGFGVPATQSEHLTSSTHGVCSSTNVGSKQELPSLQHIGEVGRDCSQNSESALALTNTMCVEVASQTSPIVQAPDVETKWNEHEQAIEMRGANSDRMRGTNSDRRLSSRREPSLSGSGCRSLPIALNSQYSASSLEQVSAAAKRGKSKEKRGTSAGKRIRRSFTDRHADSEYACVRMLEGAARSDLFELFFAILIILNSSIMCFEAQYWGLESGHDIGIPGSRSPSESWPFAETVFNMLDIFFGVAFTCEVIIKLAGLRVRFLASWWNWFDTIIIASWLMHSASEVLPVNPFFLRLLRLARLVRLLRLVKTIQVFDILHLMAASLTASVYVLFWSVVLLVGIMMSAALVLVSVIDFYITDSSTTEANRLEAYLYFGTFSRAILSVFELTLGNWVPLTRFLHENISEWFGVGIMVYHCVVSFAVVMVIRGVFLHETFQAAGESDDLMILRQRRLKTKAVSKMEALFFEADESGDGYLSREEFKKVMTDNRVKTWLAALGLEVRDVENMFEVIDDGDNYISAEEFVTGFTRLKGPARSIDMVQVLRLNRTIGELIQEIGDVLGCDRKWQICLDRLKTLEFEEPESPIPLRNAVNADNDDRMFAGLEGIANEGVALH